MSGDNDSSTNNPQEQNSEDWLKAAADWWSEALSVDGAGFRARLDAEIRAARPQPANIPTTFDAHFREHALPRLEFWARYLGKRIALKDWDYGWCHDVLVREALTLGAADTSDFRGLIDHLADRLIEAVMAHDQETG